ncbi:MAG: hypothetical protein PHE70_04725 [Tepidanaerobacteraceae bacterium]|nr:hypothetical protein [Tepidanaerobacteraceae bacterium]
MYQIQTYQDKYKMYKMIDSSTGSYVEIAPERGGIIAGYGVRGQEILYMNFDTFTNPKRYVWGGIPILFPICGKLENDEHTWNGKKYNMPLHGVARNYPWQVIETNIENEASIKIRLKSNECTKKMYPFDFELIFEYVLKNDKLTINQEYNNNSDTEMPIYPGFHPYFKASNVDNLEFEMDASKYLDYEDMKIKPYTGKIDLDEQALGKMILDNEAYRVSFVDSELGRKISLEYGKEFKYVLFWSGVKNQFICVEPWMAKQNSLNTKEDVFFVKPGGVFKTYISICCEYV